MRYNIPTKAQEIINILEENGYEAYLVGGCVRDMLLGKEPSDYDICTDATPSQTIASFEGYHVIETGLKHGTVTIMLDGEGFEVTTYRTESEYTDHRRPNSVMFVKELKTDLARRDFTINSMAYNPRTGIVDYYNGSEDLQNGIISAVGNADERFSEDALRIMRALRFAACYGFDISPKTAQAVHRLSGLLSNIAAERINVELSKLLVSDGAVDILREYADVFAVFIPEIRDMIGFAQNNPHHCYDVWEHSIQALSHSPKDLVIRLAVLLHDVGKPQCYTEDEKGVGHFYAHAKIGKDMARVILRRLKYDNATRANVKELVLFHDTQLSASKKSIKRWLNKIGTAQLQRLLEVKRADDMAKTGLGLAERLENCDKIGLLIDEIIADDECYNLSKLAISGYDLIQLGVPQGKEIGQILATIMESVVSEEIPNERDILLAKARDLIN